MTGRIGIVQLGRGSVGGTLVDQIASRRETLRARAGITIDYLAIAGRRAALLDPGGIDLAGWRDRMEAGLKIGRASCRERV